MKRKHKAFAPELPMDGEEFALVGERVQEAFLSELEREQGVTVPGCALAVPLELFEAAKVLERAELRGWES